MVKLDPIIRRWYEHLNDGKLMGMKCEDCGAYEFPPVPVCGKCGGMHMNWAEISGKGDLFAFNLNSTGIYPYTEDITVSGYVKLEEGMNFIGILDGYEMDDQPALFEKLKAAGGTIPAKLKLAPLNDDWQYPHVVLED